MSNFTAISTISAALPAHCTQYYHMAVEGHFWIEWRFTIFRQHLGLLGIRQDQPLKGLDAGCGNGVVRRQIEQTTRWAIDGADLSEEALVLNTPGRGQTFLYNIQDRHPELRERYDLIIAFDVIEHIQEPADFIDALLYAVKPQGWLFINVPAIRWLYSRYDRAQNHFRRYTQKMLQDTLAQRPVEIKQMHYWGLSLIPFVMLRKILPQRHLSDREILQRGFNPPGKWMNTLLLKIMRLETTYLKKPILGTSLMVSVVKEPGGTLPSGIHDAPNEQQRA